MCLNISDVFNVNQYLGDCVVNERFCPFPTLSELDSSLSWQRKNELKCIVAGGCTFAGGIVATLGGWTWLVTGAAMGAIGNLASYRYTRMTQEQLDHDANVKMLVEERASMLARLSKLEENDKEETNAKLRAENEIKERIAQLEKTLTEYQALLLNGQMPFDKKD